MSGTPNPLDMDDEAFAKLSSPPETVEPVKQEEETTQEEVVDDTTSDDVSQTEDNDPVADADKSDEASETESGDEGTQEKPDVSTMSDEELLKTEAPTDKAKPEEKAAESESADQKPDGDKKPESEKQEDIKAEEKSSVSADVAIGFYEKIMKPFKANGKEIELKSPEEAIQLMQMGANYTRKLQEMQPHKKMLLMLQNNDMLNEEKLSFLIDLHNKKPEAIKKLIKDAEIDPIDLDINDEASEYQAEDHSVTDNEVEFRSAIDELTSSATGKETLVEINSKWDQASKDALWDKPEIMSVIHQQRELGIYDVITTELDRRITLGQIPAGTPFLEGYKLVGDELAAEALKSSGKGDAQEADESSKDEKPTAQPVAKRAATPKAKIANDDKAKAASPSRGSPTNSGEKPVVNYLAQDDSEFLKNFNGRV